MHRRRKRVRGTGLLLAVSAGAAGLLAWNALRQQTRARPPISDAPRRALRRRSRGNGSLREQSVVGRSVTINRPREDLYAYWRDFSQLPDFMENVKRVEILEAERSRWTIAGPGGTDIIFTSRITDDRPNELIAWKSEEDSPVRHSGRIEFREAPGGRGTQLSATIAYDAPAGEAGRVIAKLFQREPNIQARRELKRFKQLMETGEIADSASHPPEALQ